jgi:hypothetical protein
MALKTGIFSLALGALLLGSTAQADDTQQFQDQQDDTQVQAQGFRGGDNQPRDNDDNRQYGRGPDQDRGSHGRYRRMPQPQPPQNQQGRYELKLMQQWTAGRYEQVWVPQDCHYKPRWGASKCRDGYYDQQWVAAHYETVEQWVWVPARWQRHSGPEWGTPASYRY